MNASFRTKMSAILRVSEDALTDEFPLNSDYWDSLGLMGTIAAIDEVYGVIIPTGELEQCSTIADLMDAVHRHSGKR